MQNALQTEESYIDANRAIFMRLCVRQIIRVCNVGEAESRIKFEFNASWVV